MSITIHILHILMFGEVYHIIGIMFNYIIVFGINWFRVAIVEAVYFIIFLFIDYDQVIKILSYWDFILFLSGKKVKKSKYIKKANKKAIKKVLNREALDMEGKDSENKAVLSVIICLSSILQNTEGKGLRIEDLVSRLYKLEWNLNKERTILIVKESHSKTLYKNQLDFHYHGFISVSSKLSLPSNYLDLFRVQFAEFESSGKRGFCKQCRNKVAVIGYTLKHLEIPVLVNYVNNTFTDKLYCNKPLSDILTGRPHRPIFIACREIIKYKSWTSFCINSLNNMTNVGKDLHLHLYWWEQSRAILILPSKLYLILPDLNISFEERELVFIQNVVKYNFHPRHILMIFKIIHYIGIHGRRWPLVHKMRILLLIGYPNRGKSSFIILVDIILGPDFIYKFGTRLNDCRGYLPASYQLLFFDDSIHQNEFHTINQNIPLLLNVLGSVPILVDVKCKKPILIPGGCSVITTNDSNLFTYQRDALQARILKILLHGDHNNIINWFEIYKLDPKGLLAVFSHLVRVIDSLDKEEINLFCYESPGKWTGIINKFNLKPAGIKPFTKENKFTG